MVKAKSLFVCQQCGTEFAKWQGRCSACGEWNSLVESTRVTGKKTFFSTAAVRQSLPPQKLAQIKVVKRFRLPTGIGEFDRVLGGGVVPGSLVLLAGEPGIGKSTLTLQVAGRIKNQESRIKNKNKKIRNSKFEIRNSVLYISGEESLEQIKIRAERLVVKADNLLLLAETDIDQIMAALVKQQETTALVIIDSIQTLYSSELSSGPGSVGQVRGCATRLLRFAKASGVAVFLVGHVTKQGVIAGPKVLEHMVDTVIYFEGDRFGDVRLLRASKNRFGATDEVGIFEMTDQGLNEVANPSKLFLKTRKEPVPGSVVVVTMEGTRPVLVEIQALVVPTQLSVPRRVAQGIDYNRLQLIAAVLSKRLGLPLGGSDIYVNITGGFKVEEPAADLGVALAIISSFKNKPLPNKLACFGELGLLGELRNVSQAGKRVKEARRLGFTTIINPEKVPSIGQASKKIFLST